MRFAPRSGGACRHRAPVLPEDLTGCQARQLSGTVDGRVKTGPLPDIQQGPRTCRDPCARDAAATTITECWCHHPSGEFDQRLAWDLLRLDHGRRPRNGQIRARCGVSQALRRRDSRRRSRLFGSGGRDRKRRAPRSGMCIVSTVRQQTQARTQLPVTSRS